MEETNTQYARTKQTILLSYDVAGEARSVAARVCHLVFGRADQGNDAEPPYIERPGVVWIGQSVLVMPRPTAEELAAKLRALGATVAMAAVSIDHGDLKVFRRRPRGQAMQLTC